MSHAVTYMTQSLVLRFTLEYTVCDIFIDLLILNFSYSETYDPYEGCYEGYRDPNLPDGYEAYGEIVNVEEFPRPKQSCCKTLRSGCSDMGRLIHALLASEPWDIFSV